MTDNAAVGDEIVVEVGPVAHGGHCVARHEGRVIFVRHGLPGERVRVRVTAVGRRGRFLRADVTQVLRSAPGRREAPCPVALRCGGCDWQHATVPASRALKEDVVRAAMQRFAGIDLGDRFGVAPVALAEVGPDSGLGWRTRGTLSVDGQGWAGFRAPRSHEVVVAGQCLQLHERLGSLGLFTRRWSGERVGFVAPAGGPPQVFDPDRVPRGTICEHAAGREWRLAVDGFWQVHPAAADALVASVHRMAQLRAGERLVDLYSGVGLFGLSLAALADLEQVTLVESDRRACGLAAHNAAGLPVHTVAADVRAWVRGPAALAGADCVVLDPPRTGAGSEVVRSIVAAQPRGVVYVACDPVALARDVATFADHGYAVRDLEAFDLFPTTHHVECVAALTPR